MDMPVKDIPKDLFDKVLYGSGEEKLYFRYVNEFGQVKENEILFEGVIPNIERRYRETVLIIFVSKWRNIWQSKLVRSVKVDA